MFTWLKYVTELPQLVQFVQAIVAVVSHVETLFQSGAAGDQKRAMAIGLVGQAISLGAGFGITGLQNVDPKEIESVVGQAIDNVVALMNTIGVFKHAAPAAAPGAPAAPAAGSVPAGGAPALVRS